MPVNQLIEEMIIREMKGLCASCLHAPSCVYFRMSKREIIQCEMFEEDKDQLAFPAAGLCKTCDHAQSCKLPGRKQGVWHCDEFL